MKKKMIFWLVLFSLLLFGGLIYNLANQGKLATEVNKSITVTDSLGKTMVIPSNPQRVVILNASNTELYVASGGGKYIAGKATSPAYSEKTKEATANAKEVGIIHNPSVETILSLKPDLVIGTNVPFHQNLGAVLEDAKIPLYINEVKTFENIYDSLKLFGRLSLNEAGSLEKIEELKAEQGKILSKVEGKKVPKNLIIFGSPESFSMATNKTFTGELITMLGGGNIADSLEVEGGYIPLNMEFLAKENPEVIFIIMMGNTKVMEEKINKDLKADSVWQELRAVQNNRVHILPYELFTVNPGIRAGEALEILADYMYVE